MRPLTLFLACCLLTSCTQQDSTSVPTPITPASQPLRILAWNVESNGADVAVIAEQLNEFNFSTSESRVDCGLPTARSQFVLLLRPATSPVATMNIRVSQLETFIAVLRLNGISDIVSESSIAESDQQA